MKKIWIILTALALFTVYCDGEMMDETEIGSDNSVLLSSGLSSSQKETILAVHNEERNLINNMLQLPESAKIPDLAWDTVLADSAQSWAKKCNYTHSDTGAQYGENLAASILDEVEHIAGLWVDEKYEGAIIETNGNIYEFYHFLDSTLYSFVPGYNHYTQVVWRRTTKIGCGYATCDDLILDWKMNLLVCHYQNRGNYIGQPIY
ncbi:MAG: CAP domain-containing protein [bacterium]|nr:CAP domain-containing protein [bacterium]